MKRFIVVILFAAGLCLARAGLQTTAPAAGAGNISNSGTPAALNIAQWTDSTHVKGVAQGVFNVRTMYGAVPDGSTDNATTIAAAFTAANAVTSGSPTVYFDCDASLTTCVYNYGGSGTSPINPTVPMTIQCAPNVLLNYTGTAHAVDVGPSNRTFADFHLYRIQDCGFTGGATYTQGIYLNNWIANVDIIHNYFLNFGNRTGYTVSANGNNWSVLMDGNNWQNTDGSNRNIFDAHAGTNVFAQIINSNVGCLGLTGQACAVSNPAVGFWFDFGVFANNILLGPEPLVRIGSGFTGSGQGLAITDNVFATNSGSPTGCITYGDPSTAGANLNLGITVKGNNFYCPAVSGVSPIGPEAASSGSHQMGGLTLSGNTFTSTPAGSAPYFNSNGGTQNFIGSNFGPTASTILNQASSPPVLDTGFSTNKARFALHYYQNNGGSPANSIAAWDTSGVNLTRGNYHLMSAPYLCSDSTGSGTAQTCSTTPSSDRDGTAVTVVTGDMILYKTTTTNTGALTIAVNGGAAKSVKKNGSAANALAAGDLQAGIYYVLTFDGTNWALPAYATVVPTSCTGIPAGALWNNAGTPAICP